MAVAMTTPAYNQEKTELEEAIEDVEAGRVYSCSSVQELMALAN